MLSPDDKSEFARVYDAEVERVFGFLAYRTGVRALAEDLTQQAFERALRSWDRFDPERGSASTWIFSIARNLLVDHFRRDGSRDVVPLDPAHRELATDGPAESLTANDLSADLATALSDLTAAEREVVALRFGGAMKGPEIAELTGKSLANVHQIQSRAMQKLRASLAREASGAPPLERTA